MKLPVNSTEQFHKQCLRFKTRFIYNNLVTQFNYGLLQIFTQPLQ